MNAKLELYRRYYCVYRNIHPFSILIEWADAYILQIGYEDHIYELSITKDRKEALFLSEKILDEITFNNQNLEIESISDNTNMFDALPHSSDTVTLLEDNYNHQKYKIDSILIYQIEFDNYKFTNKSNNGKVTLSTFECNKWIEEIYKNRDRIRQFLLKYLEDKYNADFNIYKEAHVLDYLYEITDILFDIESDYSVISLSKTNLNLEEYQLPDLQAEYISIELDRNANITSIE